MAREPFRFGTMKRALRKATPARALAPMGGAKCKQCGDKIDVLKGSRDDESARRDGYCSTVCEEADNG
jgi:hypothetical protein